MTTICKIFYRLNYSRILLLSVLSIACYYFLSEKAIAASKEVKVEIWSASSKDSLILYCNSDSIILKDDFWNPNKKETTKNFFLKITNNDVKSLQRALLIPKADVDGKLGKGTIGPIKDSAKTVIDKNKKITLFDSTTQISFILSPKFQVKEAIPKHHGWLANDQPLFYRHLYQFNQDIDSVNISYNPIDKNKLDSLNLLYKDKFHDSLYIFIIDTSPDSNEAILIFKQDKSLNSINIKYYSREKFETDSLLNIESIADAVRIGSFVQLKSFFTDSIFSNVHDSEEIQLDFLFISNGKLGFTINVSKIEAKSVGIFQDLWFWTTLSFFAVSTLFIVLFLKSRKKSKQASEFNFRDFNKSLKDNCPDLFKNLTNDLDKILKNIEIDKKIKSLLISQNPKNPDELIELIQGLWELRKSEILYSISEDETRRYETVEFAALMERFNEIISRPGQIFNQIVDNFKTHKFLFDDININIEKNIEKNVKFLDDLLIKLEKTIKEIGEKVNYTNGNWEILRKNLISKIEDYIQAEESLNSIAVSMPLIFGSIISNKTIPVQNKQKMNFHLLELVDGLEKWSKEYNEKSGKIDRDKINNKFQKYYILIDIEQTIDYTKIFEQTLEQELYDIDKRAKRLEAIKRIQEIQNEISALKNLVLFKETSENVDPHNGNFIKISNERFNKILAISDNLPTDIKFIYLNLVALFHVLSEYRNELEFDRKNIEEQSLELIEQNDKLIKKENSVEKLRKELNEEIEKIKNQNLDQIVENLNLQKIHYENLIFEKKREYNEISQKIKNEYDNKKNELETGFHKQESLLLKTIDSLRDQLADKDLEFENQIKELRENHDVQIDRIKEEFTNYTSILQNTVHDAEKWKNYFINEEQKLKNQISVLQDRLSKAESKHPELAKIILERDNAKMKFEKINDYFKIPQLLRSTRSSLISMKSLFEGYIKGLAKNSYPTFWEEYEKLERHFNSLSSYFLIDEEDINIEDIDKIINNFNNFNNEKLFEILKNSLILMGTPFCKLFQHAYHVEQVLSELKIEVERNYLRFRSILSEYGIYLHQIVLFETRSTSSIYEERGFGCTTPVLKEIYNELAKKGLLPSPCISDVLRLGYISLAEGIESEKSVVRVYYK